MSIPSAVPRYTQTACAAGQAAKSKIAACALGWRECPMSAACVSIPRQHYCSAMRADLGRPKGHAQCVTQNTGLECREPPLAARVHQDVCRERAKTLAAHGKTRLPRRFFTSRVDTSGG